jgi:hypothetical protein
MPPLILFLLTTINAMSAANVEGLCALKEKEIPKLFDEIFIAGASRKEIWEFFSEKTFLYGECKKVRGLGGNEYLFEYSEAQLPITIQWSVRGKITNIDFGSPKFPNDSWKKIEKFAKRIFPELSLHVSKDGKSTLLDIAGEEKRNISRSVNLHLLRALQREKVSPDKIVTLSGEKKLASFGTLAEWPDGALLTVDSLRNFMMLDLDATAADHLISLIGKSAVQQTGQLRPPFFTYREYALLMRERKLPTDPRELEKRAETMNQVTRGTIPYPKERYDLVHQVGWFGSTKHLCESAYALKDHAPAYSAQASREFGRVFSGVVDRAMVYQPRDPGVSQNTILVRQKDSQEWFCVSTTVNRPSPISENHFLLINQRVFSFLGIE